ncbi:MAG TPA: bifunctional 2-C-methyl-D-erythritol 4-phosphate cytidylyltransferase/2-C-methyl-D-erythritol 2,4-cyclodiphosphate synthase [Methylovirgula sp.]|nr:bifunctional 2-C-methyl-D-erythritol 4-phosphate cytidylyltransferase/2-C-methyl-D-erythritol 2,4-cyclodiphosphate synthase [Methylovirgula sp.]
MDENFDRAILVVAAGRGLRAGPGVPKQYRPLGGVPLLARTLSTLLKGAPGARLLVVIHPDDLEDYRNALRGLDKRDLARLFEPAYGGEARQDSVRLGLEALARHGSPQIVLIHDAARPFASADLLARAEKSARDYGAAVPALPLTDTIKEVDGSRILSTPARAAYRTVQTPQAFAFDMILAAHRKAAEAGQSNLTDDAAVAEWAGHAVHIFEGERENMKVTSTDDFAQAETKLLRELSDVRTGQGFDVHAFGSGDHVWLGGVRIPHDHALLGHSDADVLLHAITDAILGAIAGGDIGSHFPPSDPQWRGAASAIFLGAAMQRLHARGGMLAHIDAMVICERPKIGPFRDAIRARIAEIAGIEIDRVAVKATTAERLGFIGREEGVAAMAIATVRLPSQSGNLDVTCSP